MFYEMELELNPFYPRCPAPWTMGFIIGTYYEFLTFSITFKSVYKDPEL